MYSFKCTGQPIGPKLTSANFFIPRKGNNFNINPSQKPIQNKNRSQVDQNTSVSTFTSNNNPMICKTSIKKKRFIPLYPILNNYNQEQDTKTISSFLNSKILKHSEEDNMLSVQKECLLRRINKNISFNKEYELELENIQNPSQLFNSTIQNNSIYSNEISERKKEDPRIYNLKLNSNYKIINHNK